jgi:hypothetical protein
MATRILFMLERHGHHRSQADINPKVHVVCEADHSDMFGPIYDRNLIDEPTVQAAIRAAQKRPCPRPRW